MSERAFEDRTLGQSFAFLFRARWLAIGMACVAGAAGWAWAEHRGVVRRARAVLHVERATAAVPGGDVAHYAESRNYAAAQASLLRSGPTLQRALAAFEGKQSPLFEDVADRLAFVKKRLAVAAGADDGLLTVTLDASCIEDACLLVNEVVASYVARLMEVQRGSVDGALHSILRELERTEAELRKVEAEQRAFTALHPGLAVDAESRRALAGARLTELASALAQAEVAAMLAASDRAAAEACARAEDPLKAAPFPGMDDAAVRRLGELQQRIEDAAQRRAQLLSLVTSEHPEAKVAEEAIEREREQARDSVRRMALSIAAASKARVAAAEQSKRGVEERMRAEERRLADEEPLLAELHALEARLSRARRASDALHERARAVAAASDVGDTAAMARSAVVYERADAATSSIVQSSSAVAAAAALAGIAIAVAWAWLRAAMRPRVHGMWDLPIEQQSLVEFGPTARRVRDALRADPRLRGAAHVAAARLAARFGGRGALCVAGASQDAGLGSVAMAIASACAEQGHRTLLIDPFGAVSTRGAFADAVQGRATPLRAAIPSNTEGLSLLSGDPADCQDPRLFGDAFAELLEGSLQRFDRVFVVVPEMAHRVESQRCAAHCGTTFIVLRAGRTLRSDAILAIDALAAVGASCGGLLMHGCGNAAARMAPPPSARPMPASKLPAATDRGATLHGRNTTEASA
jgi:hypothetical protein